MTRIEQLPSGFWVVWIGSEWVDASSTTRAEAEAKAEQFRTK